MAERTQRTLPAASQALPLFVAQIRPLLRHLTTAVQTRLQHALAQEAPAASPQGLGHRQIRQAYHTWLAEQGRTEQSEQPSLLPEAAQPHREQQQQRAFSEQTGYVCFVRILLARVLEDKGIGPGFASGHAYINWLRALQNASPDFREGLPQAGPLPPVYGQMAALYQKLCAQAIFDWFEPDDSLLALLLRQLRHFTCADISNDLPGFTYEALIARGARNRRGHFLTPPEVVEFMLDRAGYRSQDCLGANLLDPSCGSGSFLVHAARRLREAIGSALAHCSPCERARYAIEQVQTRLVGLEIDPFACSLARLNLFLQLLDDLTLLWHAGEQPVVASFAIYNTNSLEMPLPGARMATADEGAPIKALPQHFRYILCNPPYINRGIILQAKRYAQHPFYRDVVKGDENFSLLFLRLATYYLAERGTLCYICPLNLLGDESTMRARDLFSQREHWRLRSITRFYSRTALFPGVLQGVCVVRIDRQTVREADTIEIRGGSTISAAEHHSIQIAYPRVINNYPPRTTWSKPWLVHAQPEVYDLWEAVQQRSQQDLAGLIAGKLHAAKGDVRSTWSQPMRVPAEQPGVLPVTKGAHIEEWGNWEAAAYLDPAVSLPTGTARSTSSLWVQRRLQRILNLAHSETVLLLKEITGLEMHRPLRGTLTSRSASQPFVADETVLVLYTHDPAYEQLACALFGLITSGLYNYFFNLFSTNAHANLKELLRLPVPAWNDDLERHLATATRAVLRLSGAPAACQSEITPNLRQRELARRQDLLEQQVLAAYGIEQSTWKQLIVAGFPWSRGPARTTP